MTEPNESAWNVMARDPNLMGSQWTEWTTWVDRATAEAESLNAKDNGFAARIVRAR